jgi:hypothetical protein
VCPGVMTAGQAEPHAEPQRSPFGPGVGAWAACTVAGSGCPGAPGTSSRVGTASPAACFLTLYFATLALDSLLGNPWTEQLTSIAERFDMPTALPTRQTP